jgi:hypothetical protein
MTHNEARMLRFAIRYDGWHSYGRDVARTARRLAGHGLLEISATRQFRLARPVSEIDITKLPASETGTQVTP